MCEKEVESVWDKHTLATRSVTPFLTVAGRFVRMNVAGMLQSSDITLTSRGSRAQLTPSCVLWAVFILYDHVIRSQYKTISVGDTLWQQNTRQNDKKHLFNNKNHSLLMPHCCRICNKFWNFMEHKAEPTNIKQVENAQGRAAIGEEEGKRGN